MRVSFDDVATWRDAPVAPGDGGYRVTVAPPPGAAGFVSLKATAHIADGATTEQTVLRAYRLTP